jgi:hypothetical protein
MDLFVDNVAAYLVERGLLPSEQLGEAIVKDVSRRNRNFRVLARQDGFMVKQPRAAEDIPRLRREAFCYEMARSDAELARLMPPLLIYDAPASILVTKLASDAESLADRNKRGSDISPMFGEKLGEAMGRHHARPVSAFESEEVLLPFLRRVPYVLNIAALAHKGWRYLGPMAPRLRELIRRRPDVERILDAFRAQWRRDCLMHGDVSWENVIVSSGAPPASDLLIVDWEMADIGDSGWDTGVVLRSFLAAWLFAHQAGRYKAEFAAGPAPPSIQVVRALTLAFWTGYARERGFDPTESRFELERGMQFAALQMAVVALELGRPKPQFHASAIEAVGVALSLFQNPRQPVQSLLGA